MATFSLPTLAQMKEKGISPEVLFWIGCAGSFDERAQKVTKAFVKLLIKAQVSFAVLGKEESCTGDPAKRAGNEFLYQTQAMSNIKVLNHYKINQIVTTCPHCFNTLKNEYPALGYECKVTHHTEFLQQLINQGKLTIESGKFKGKRITFHDPCYLGRANNIYEAPRELLKKIDAELIEMKSCKNKSLCCGAGGSQMFKEPEKGQKNINTLRIEEAIVTKSDILATGCPFCSTMLAEGIIPTKNDVTIMDVAELIANAKDL